MKYVVLNETRRKERKKKEKQTKVKEIKHILSKYYNIEEGAGEVYREVEHW